MNAGDEIRFSRSDQVGDWESNVKRNEARQGKSKQIHQMLFSFFLYFSTSSFYTACADKEQYVWPQIPDTVKAICGQRGKKYEKTHKVSSTHNRTQCAWQGEWGSHLYMDESSLLLPTRERVGELEWRVGGRAESSLASKHFPLLFQCCHCYFQ